MVNFKEETLEDLRRHGKTIGDIRWIGDNSGKRTTDIKEFFNSINFRYDDGFGCVAISQSVTGNCWGRLVARTQGIRRVRVVGVQDYS